MIGSIGRQRDIEVYLEEKEIEKLEEESLEGTIISWQKPWLKGDLFLETEARTGIQIEVRLEDYGHQEDGSFEVGEVYLNMKNDTYELLKKRGVVTPRYHISGSKVKIHDRERLSISEENMVENLEFYDENSEKLEEKLKGL
ncbi:MAG: hypothetical protein ACLFS3_00365 [Candidatus Aenigmatarchaeota archaeon]